MCSCCAILFHGWFVVGSTALCWRRHSSVNALAAGLAAHQDVRTAQALLGLLVALQAGFTLHVLVVWPYISQVLNLIELSCSCLEVAYLGVTIAVYNYMQGNLELKDARVEVRPAGLSVALPHAA